VLFRSPPATFALHDYQVNKSCAISCGIKSCMSSVLDQAQASFERTLAGITLADVVADIRAKDR